MACNDFNSKFLFLLVLGSAVIAAPTSASAQCGTTPPTGAVTWTTQWCDEFNGAANSPIDPTNWTFNTGNSGFGNNELETYCDPSDNTSPCSTSSPNAYIDGLGHLAIQVRGVLNGWTSARLKTLGLRTFHAGRIEASLQFPSHAGLWPAFWMLGSQQGVNWPTVGESDIMENWPTTVLNGPGATGNCSTIHTQVTAGPGKGHCFTFPSGQQVDTAFHLYGQIWSANMLQFYVDDPTQPFFIVTAADLASNDTWPFSSANNPFFLIMNMAVGGTLGGPTDSGTGVQNPMLADYVRQYAPSAISTQLATPSPITIQAGATSGNSTTLNITQAQGTGRVTFSCATTAPKASCAVTSNDAVNNHTVDFSGSSSASATVTVSTTANTSAAGISGASRLSFMAAAGLILLISLTGRAGREIRLGAGLICMALAIGLSPGCGGSGGGGGGGGGGGSNGTTPGTYTVTVKAYNISSSDAASPSASTTFNLTVN